MKNKNSVLYVIIVILIVVIVILLTSGRSKDDVQSQTTSPSQTVSFESAVGQKAPDFSLESLQGNTVKLSDFKGKNVVLFFNEGGMCYPACWNQIRVLAADERFNSIDTVAFSIVVDAENEWQKIAEKNPEYGNAKILFDTDRIVSKAYGVLNLSSSMHPGNYPGHTYVVIDKGGVIRFTLDDPNMAIQNDQIAAEVKKLNIK